MSFETEEHRDFAFDHLGIATADAGSLVDLFGGLLGAVVAHEEEFEGMRVVFLAVGDRDDDGDEGVYLELLEPGDESRGAIADFLDSRGPGIHHVAFRTDDLAGALATAHELGVDLIDEEPRPGAWGHQVAFLHPRSTGRVLVELVDRHG